MRAAAAELLGAWTAPAPYARIATTYQKTTPVNLKIETPDKQNATFDAALHLRDVRHRSRLPGDGARQLHVRRVDHRPRAEPDSEPGRAELRRQFAVRGAGRSGTRPAFGGTAISNPQNTPKVEASFRDELAKTLAGGFTADEVAAAKKALRDQRVGRAHRRMRRCSI